jgi:hypothetical protein
MTTPTPPAPATPDKKLVKDVASEIERRRRRRRLVTLVAILALAIAAALYLQCGRGWGLGGGKGSGAGPGSGPGSGSALAAPTRCTLRVTMDGILVDGASKTRDEAVNACKGMKDGAVVTVTGDARQGDWDELRAALEAVGVKIYMRGQESDGVPQDAGSTTP